MAYLVKQSHRAPAVTAPVPVDESLPRACVIGAGSSGIAAAKQLYLAGIPFDCFEKGSDIGGDVGPRQLQRPVGLLRHPRDQHVVPADGLLRLPDAGGLPALRAPRPGARLLRAVRRPLRLPPHDHLRHDGRGRLARRPTAAGTCAITGPDGTETRTYDAVLVANGHHWDPRWPEPAYPGDLRRRADPRPRLPLRRPARRTRRRRGRRRQLGDGHRGRVVLRGAYDDVVGAPHRVGAAQVPPRQAERPGRPAGLGAVVGDRRAAAHRGDVRRQHDEVRPAGARPTSPGSRTRCSRRRSASASTPAR